jgi:hypothetical protein
MYNDRDRVAAHIPKKKKHVSWFNELGNMHGGISTYAYMLRSELYICIYVSQALNFQIGGSNHFQTMPTASRFVLTNLSF